MTTHVLVIADSSGSMYDIAPDVRGGHNAYLDLLAQEMATDSTVDYRVTVTTFNTLVFELDMALEPSRATRFSLDTYLPQGSTALLDAVGRTVTTFRNKITLADGDRVKVVIITDGEENASVEFRHTDILALVTELEAAGWAFLYIGAGLDDWSDARKTGLGQSSVRIGDSGEQILRTYTGLATTTSLYAHDTTRTMSGLDLAAALQRQVDDGGSTE